LHLGRRARLVSLVGSIVVLLVPLTASEASPRLDVKGMTFVASREGDHTLILHADRARFDTDSKKAYLSDVDAVIPATPEQQGFKMWCDSSVVDLATNDFVATGNVRGQIESGEQFVAEWVRYDHAVGLLYTDAPVRMLDRGTTVEGGGFDYRIESRSFRLRGGVKVVQDVEASNGDGEK